MQKFLKFLLMIAVLCTAISCVKEPFDNQEILKRETDYQTINFGYRTYNDISITTKSTLPSLAEKRILSLYVFVFDNSGNLIYKRLFDADTRVNNISGISGANATWYVEELDPSVGQYTHGVVRIKSNNVENGHLYIIANIDDPISNLSQYALSVIDSETQINNFIVQHNVHSVQSTGNFIMTSKSSVTINGDDIALGAAAGSGAKDLDYLTSQRPDVGKVMMLKGVDVKVEFNIGIVPGAETIRTEWVQGVETSVIQTIKSFTPTSWQVINVPVGCYLLEREEDAPNDITGGYFNTPNYSFEIKRSENYNNDPAKPRVVNSFSFYMLENRQSAECKESVSSNYHLRDKRVKNAAGTYNNTGDKWVYAPENATYVIVKGNVAMDYNDGVLAQQTLHTEATYYIHLGDFIESMDNYDLCRNTHYTYNVNIHGVDKIQVEVEKDNRDGYNPLNEMESGATGDVFVSQEPVKTFDAHYGQAVFRFNAQGILRQCNGEISKLTWFVSTPFGRKGSPDRVGLDGGVDVPTGLDYKWIHFVINSKNETYIEKHGNPDTGGEYAVINHNYPNYCQFNRMWPEGGSNNENVLNVIQLCDFLRNETQKYADGLDNAFDNNGDIYVTAFIDEFYYNEDPISNEKRKSLWKEFVNKPPRVLHILCDFNSSIDGESTLIKSAVTIRQLSIQTIYNVNTSAEGWGTESEDEMMVKDTDHNKTWFFSTTENRSTNWKNYNLNSVKNRSRNNGLFNSGQLWGVLTGGPDIDKGSDLATYSDNKRWTEHLNYIKPNNTDYYFLKEDGESNTMRYACLSRNRDENGDGIIDKDEIKWYMASITQLQLLYLGDAGLSSSAKLYNIENTTGETIGSGITRCDTWRSHIVSSTAENYSSDPGNFHPTILWAEEGISTGAYASENGYSKQAVQSVRCLRNLDIDSYHTKNIADPLDYPEPPISVTSNGEGVYTFNSRNLNELSKRLNVHAELLPLDENSAMSLLPNSFTTGPYGNDGNALVSEKTTQNTNNYWKNEIMENLKRSISPCPAGYRIPNIREMAAAYIFIPFTDPFWKYKNAYFIVSNYYSFGHVDVGGNGYDSGDASIKAYTWFISPNGITVDAATYETYIRCVKDND